MVGLLRYPHRFGLLPSLVTDLGAWQEFSRRIYGWVGSDSHSNVGYFRDIGSQARSRLQTRPIQEKNRVGA